MKLLSLILKNFKGIKDFTLMADGENLTIKADNAVGKTSIYDAFLWLITNKDSQGKSLDDSIKTRTPDSKPIHHLDHEAEAILDLNGRKVSLKKVYHEVWTKKRGSATDTFTGHETLHFVDGVPKSKKEYDSFISGIANEETFKLLTNPFFFNGQLHWQKRREILLEVCGDISDSDVIASDYALTPLKLLLNNRTVDDVKKVIKAQQKKVNEEIEKIPGLINENNRMMPDVNALPSRELLTIEIATFRQQMSDKQQELARVENGGETAELTVKLREAESRLLDVKNAYREANEDKSFAKRQELNRLNAELSGVNTKIEQNIRQREHNKNQIDRWEVERQKKVDQWNAVHAEVFEKSIESVCPTCKQNLPADQVELAKKTALEAFNLSKAQRKERINLDGKGIREQIDSLVEQNKTLAKEADGLTANSNTLKKQIADLQAEIAEVKPADAVETTKEYQGVFAEIADIKGQIFLLNTQKQEVVQQIKTDIASIESEITNRNTQVTQHDTADKNKKRIAELEQQEKTLAAEYERLEGELYLLEMFTRAKVSLLEDKINSKFEIVKWKLFENQINEGLKEICTAMVEGVEFGKGLNRAAEINVGLDCIRTLSRHYNFFPTIWIDNCEAISRPLEMNCQVIKLYVSEPDKELRVVIDG